MIDERILQRLAEEFKREDERGTYEERREHWWKSIDFLRGITSLDGIERMTEEDALLLYKNAGHGIKMYPHSFMENGLDKIKAALKYLIYADQPLAQRFYNVVDQNGTHKLFGAGRDFASFLLCAYDSEEYAIWNAAADEGLKLLKMKPAKRRGEKIGETYVKVRDALKNLQSRCGFADLRVTDDFIELIGHGLLGRDVIKAKPKPEAIEIIEVEEREIEEIPESEKDLHTKMQWLLIKIGLLERHDVWVAKNDKNKSFHGEVFGDLCLAELPKFAGPNVLRIAESIDVIWFREKTATPVKFFEVEHSTSIYSGLLRLNDVIVDYPIPEAAIVAPKQRRRLFNAQISRRTFNISGLAEVCRFMSYEDIERLYGAETVRTGLL